MNLFKSTAFIYLDPSNNFNILLSQYILLKHSLVSQISRAAHSKVHLRHFFKESLALHWVDRTHLCQRLRLNEFSVVLRLLHKGEVLHQEKAIFTFVRYIVQL